ncbi:nitrate reductase associated protein [[Phormidium] sp. ETS-05]|uniref:nitrate reductase associated protein n=1 Tax=[Phormidium] sp. ETS-05 TaxID=222819 RepID=UPI0018EF1003|nr:nitrate reductase associated protein [[Phormidium] sp. ETS-05]
MTMFFEFESEFVDSLHCIPMQVRLKLDTCGIKLKLSHWNKFTQEERLTLVEQPCTNNQEIREYRKLLQKLVLERTGEEAKDMPLDEAPAWLDSKNIPEAVQEKAGEVGVNLTVEQWADLQIVQRFALIKLSRSSHENSNFLPALQEFNLV